MITRLSSIRSVAPLLSAMTIFKHFILKNRLYPRLFSYFLIIYEKKLVYGLGTMVNLYH